VAEGEAQIVENGQTKIQHEKNRGRVLKKVRSCRQTIRGGGIRGGLPINNGSQRGESEKGKKEPSKKIRARGKLVWGKRPYLGGREGGRSKSWCCEKRIRG